MYKYSFPRPSKDIFPCNATYLQITCDRGIIVMNFSHLLSLDNIRAVSLFYIDLLTAPLPSTITLIKRSLQKGHPLCRQ